MADKYKKRRKEKFWSGSGKFFLTVIIMYLIFYGINEIKSISDQRSDLYKKDNIEIKGNRLVTSDKILRICGFAGSNNPEVKVNFDSLASRLMKLKYIKGISITHRPPQLLNITVEEYEPVAFIYGKGLNLIDRDGFLIPVPFRNLLWDFPFISGIDQKLGVQGKMTTASDAYLALEIVRYLDDENPLLASMISEINLGNKKSIELYMIKGGTKIRVNRDSFYKELFILKNYVANYLDWSELARIDYIDLRFKNQLIVKSKT